MDTLGSWVGALGLAIAIGMWLYVRRVIRSSAARSRALTAALDAFAGGRFDYRVSLTDRDPVLTRFNAAAGAVERRIHELDYRHQVGVALFASMSEAVVAVDVEHRVLELNVAAARLFDLADLDAVGRPLIDVIRNPRLSELVQSALESVAPTEGEFVVRSGDRDRDLQVTGSRIRGPEGAVLGAIIVLADVSRLRRLESVRRDFVANVSHELRTPITTLTASLEALEEAATIDAESQRLLSMARRQVTRLQAIVEDLLALSRLEAREGEESIPFETQPVCAIVGEAVVETEAFASARGVTIETDVPSELEVRVWPDLGVRAVSNLLDNAIKFSPEGGVVRVFVRREEGGLRLGVTDAGPGIATPHIPRIFERFYMVDRARSRHLGGTGLGLAIVRHVMKAHGGSVEVESAIGSGSTFYLDFPAKAERLTQP
jgi:two-component system phosphate regulon sensor histidine kinase PhoR